MDEARARYVALKRRRRRARNRSAVEGPGNGSHNVASPAGDRKAADSGRQRSGAGIGATLADVWPEARP